MNEIWVMSVTTSLPGVRFYEAMPNNMFAFDSFPKAKAALRELLRSYAFAENAMFDGQGNMKYMKQYMDDVMDWDDENDEDENYLSESVADKLTAAFHALFSGNDTCLDITPGEYDDGMIRVTVEQDAVAFEGVNDGPINGYTPLANTNMFSMQEEKDYYLHIDDSFGISDEDASAELYIELKKVTLQ